MNSRALYSSEPARGWLAWGALAPFLCLVIVALSTVGVDFVLEHFRLTDARGDPLGIVGLGALLLFPFALLGLVVLAWVRFVERRSLATIGLLGADQTKTFLRGHAIGLAMSSGVVAAIWIAGGYEAHGVLRALGSPSALLNIALLLPCFALQSSVEEIVFRGWLLSLIARKLNVALGVVLTSIVFALLHYGPHQHWLVTLGTFLFSLFACCWALRAGNIWGVMGWHAGWNWLLATGFEVPITGIDTKLPALLVALVPRGPDFLTGGAQGPEGSVCCIVFFAVSSAFIVWRRGGLRTALNPARE